MSDNAPATFTEFSRVVDRSVYRPLPSDWLVATTDVVGSTRAIEDGRYKAVNMAGASAISAVMNALGGKTFPFAFGGDGAALAVSGQAEAPVRDALARTIRWADETLGLDLRAAIVPVAKIRAAGHDVLVARHAPSPAVSYAMFAGGGVEWAEDRMKAGNFAIAPAPEGSHPDLSGLSCRWRPISNRNGVMLSLIVRQPAGVSDEVFFHAIGDVLQATSAAPAGHHPVPPAGPQFGSPATGITFEAATVAHLRPPVWRWIRLAVWRTFVWSIMIAGLRVGGFDPHRYRRQTALNSDYRKFHDGLDMTLDCSHEDASRIEALLTRLEQQGRIRHGTFRQDEALMTCIVPSHVADDHFHFIDGASGGYAEAARRLKDKAGKP